ncbi:PREDICTED: pentatricopeptide repeat-containing protein At4g17616 [Prunus mume]|uniref:Pentatricopeptide repeat-containing protein At4g17616 n=1 Tax=Prunus mume TaxID=102107 RepID=A0ABM0PK07_PRUMU|nr:PREDICTED: pentatricopeptide repeat-containing protein At4g17616 [Prunus mume]
MALIVTKEFLMLNHFIKRCPLCFCVASAIRRTIFISNYDRESVLTRKFEKPVVSSVRYEQHQISSTRDFCASVQPEGLCWEGSSHAIMLKSLKKALKEHQVNEAWESFIDFKRLHGFPEDFVIRKLITELCYSSDPHWLLKACDIVLVILKERSDLLQSDILAKLSLSLARSEMPKPATMILRILLEKENLPPMNVLCLVVLHMVKTEVGTHLASNFLVQICHCFQRSSVNKSIHAKLVKPNTMIFNLVLDACVRFKLSFKGQQIMELMPQTGVVADAHSIIIIAQIHELNGQRDEIQKYKSHIDQVSAPFMQHYRHFYDSLLSLHFKFNDIEAAIELVLQMCNYHESLPIQRDRKISQRSYLVPIGSHNLKSGLNMQILPELLLCDSVLKIEGKQELVLYWNGKLALSNRALAKLINGYRRGRDTCKLSEILLKMQKELCSLRGSRLCSDVIDACINLGWLETAHDLLDDMDAAGAPMGLTAFMSLLEAYYRGKMFREAKALLKQMRKAGFLSSIPDEMIVSKCQPILDTSSTCTNVSSATSKSDLANALVQEMRDEKDASVVYQFNSSINFFCKAKMMDDALKTYRRMQEMKIQPTEQTFTYLLYGYSSLGMIRTITILWGDIKRNMESGNLVVSRDLYEYLLLNFLRGGYFERVMEVIDFMKEHGMYTDKWLYRSEFVKLHKNLYRNLKASEARTEAQRKRLKYVEKFRKWAGVD